MSRWYVECGECRVVTHRDEMLRIDLSHTARWICLRCFEQARVKAVSSHVRAFYVAGHRFTRDAAQKRASGRF